MRTLRCPPLLLNVLLFEAGWLACVIGGSGIALFVVPPLLLGHWYWLARGAREWQGIALGTALGVSVDSALHAAGVFVFSGAFVVDGVALGVPLWLGLLWLLFLTTFNHALRWLRGRLWLATLLGALGGPSSYLAGVYLGAAGFGLSTLPALLLLAAVWAVLTPLLVQIMAWAVNRGEVSTS